MGKFALRGLAQSMARELAPKNIHVAHIVIDGAIRPPRKTAEPGETADTHLDPDAIAQTYWQLVQQPAQRLELGNRIASLARKILTNMGNWIDSRTAGQVSAWPISFSC